MGVGPSAESPQHGMAERPCKAASRNSCISGSSFLSPLGRELPVKKAASSCSEHVLGQMFHVWLRPLRSAEVSCPFLRPSDSSALGCHSGAATGACECVHAQVHSVPSTAAVRKFTTSACPRSPATAKAPWKPAKPCLKSTSSAPAASTEALVGRASCRSTKYLTTLKCP